MRISRTLRRVWYAMLAVFWALAALNWSIDWFRGEPADTAVWLMAILYALIILSESISAAMAVDERG